MCGFRETVCHAVNKVTGMCRKEKTNSNEALASIRAQLLAGERKALQNLQDSGYAVHAVDAARIEDAHNPQSVGAPVVAEGQKAYQTLHESDNPVHLVAPPHAENMNSFQSLRAQLLATDQDALETLHESVFATQAVTAVQVENVEFPQTPRVENVDIPQTAPVDHARSSQSLGAPLIAGESNTIQAPHESVFATHTVTPVRIEDMCRQPVKTCNTKRRHATKTRVRIAERKRRDLRREHGQMAAAQKRVDEHRARRAERASSGIPLCRAATKPSFTQSLASPSCLLSLNLAHDISFYENQTDEESRNYVRERLTNILGPERMKFELLPSGHNPIDPAIADYNQKMVTNDILGQWEDYKMELYRQEEEQKRRAKEEEAERLRIQVLLNHYRDIYINRLERLALYGPDLARGVELIEAALLADDHEGAASVMLALASQVLLPINALLTECKQEIPLEEIGADKLKGIWGLERLEAMYLYLQDKLDLFPEALDMLQGIEIICTAISNPTPFQDPLAPKQVPATNSYMALPDKAVEPVANILPSEGLPVLGATSAPAGSSFSKPLQATTEAINVEQQKDSAPASGGFAKLLAATAEAVNAEQQKESLPASSGFAKLPAATADKFDGSQEAVPGTALNVPPTNTAPSESTARAAVLQYIATDNMYFDSEVQDLIKRDTVVGVHRRNAIGCLKELVELANGEKGILGHMEGGSYRSQIESCVTKIDTLKGSARLNKETQALRKLCGSALMLWSVHTR